MDSYFIKCSMFAKNIDFKIKRKLDGKINL